MGGVLSGGPEGGGAGAGRRRGGGRGGGGASSSQAAAFGTLRPARGANRLTYFARPRLISPGASWAPPAHSWSAFSPHRSCRPFLSQASQAAAAAAAAAETPAAAASGRSGRPRG